jgi:hypothetical protein
LSLNLFYYFFKDLILYLLQLVQALRYENFNQQPNQQQTLQLPTIQSLTASDLTVSSSTTYSKTPSTISTATTPNSKQSFRKGSLKSKDNPNESSSKDLKDISDNQSADQDENTNEEQTKSQTEYSTTSPPLAATTVINNRLATESLSKKTFDVI